MPEVDQREWERGWDGHSQAQRRRLARMPLVEKLAWLEEAHRLIRHLERSRAAREGAPPESERP
jgi:hypothetical protein